MYMYTVLIKEGCNLIITFLIVSIPAIAPMRMDRLKYRPNAKLRQSTVE